jgi:hypothetical protein
VNIIETLNRESRERGIPFLVVGGLAVIAHGYERQTADMDIMIRRADGEAWKCVLIGLGYKVFLEQETFAQLTPPAPGLWPVDLMFVNDETFSKMSAESVEAKVRETPVRIPRVGHVIALKLHALKHTHPRRELKDLLDVVSLIEAAKLDLNGDELKQLCKRYASEKIYRKIVAASSK